MASSPEGLARAGPAPPAGGGAQPAQGPLGALGEDALKALGEATGLPCFLFGNLGALGDPGLARAILSGVSVGRMGGGLRFQGLPGWGQGQDQGQDQGQGQGPGAGPPKAPDGAILSPGPKGPTLSLPGDPPPRLTGRDPGREDALLLQGFLKGLPRGGPGGPPGGQPGTSAEGSPEGPPEGGPPGPPGLVALQGLGLGHILHGLLGTPGCEGVLALEASPAVACACLWASDLSGALSQGRVRMVLGDLAKAPTDGCAHTLRRPYVPRLFPGLYPPLGPPGRGPGPAGEGAGPAAPPEPGPGARPGARKRRLLFFQSGYYLDPELRRASLALGHDTASWDIEDFKDPLKDRGGDYRRLLEAIKSFRPEMVLTVNHLGFDTEGLLSSILARLGIPAASWFVDSPWYILGGAKLAPYPGLTAFSWDSDYLGVLRDLGFPRAFHLPLATDEGVFPGKGPPGGPAPGSQRDIAFVGDSLEAATGKYLRLAGLGPESLPRVDALARAFLADPASIPPAPLLEGAGGLLAEATGGALALSALVTWRASRLWRVRVLQRMPRGRLSIAGDKAWAGLVPWAALPGPVDYYRGLAGFYRGTKVNLNITSAQMKGGLNQRVFDVPAAGGFLLTDRRAQLSGLFEEGREVVSYAGPGEARELARFYLRNAPARERVSRAARGIILRRHLYRHRLPEIVARTLGG